MSQAHEPIFAKIQNNKPIKSPSPDMKSANIIQVTNMPSDLQQRMYYSSNSQKSKQTHHNILNLSQKYQKLVLNEHSQAPNMQRQQQPYYTPTHRKTSQWPGQGNAQESDKKDEVIRELKEVIKMLSENQRVIHSTHQIPQVVQNKNNGAESENLLKEKIKILTIQNQKLIDLIDKYKEKSKSGKKAEESPQKSTQYQQRKLTYLQNESTSLEKQNKKLIRMLKEKDESQRKLYQQIQQLKDNQKNNEKLSITKIKNQYQQNFKQFKQNIGQEVSSMFEAIRDTIEQLNKKLQISETKLIHLQQVISASKSAKKPQILIEQPSSSSETTSKQATSQINSDRQYQRDSLSRILQESRQTNQRLEEEVKSYKEELLKVKQALQEKQKQLVRESKQYQQEREELKNITQNKVKELIQSFEEQITVLKEKVQNQNTSNPNQFLQSELDKVKQLLQETQTVYKTQKEQYQAKIQYSQTAIENLNQTKESLEKEMSEAKLRNSELQKQIKHLKELNEFNLQEIQRKIETTKELQTKLGQQQQWYEILQNENAKFKAEKLQSQEKYSKLYKNIQQNHALMEKLNESFEEHMKVEIEESQIDISVSKDSQPENANIMESLQKELFKKQQIITNLQAELQKSQTLSKSYKQQLQNIQEKLIKREEQMNKKTEQWEQKNRRYSISKSKQQEDKKIFAELLLKIKELDEQRVTYLNSIISQQSP